MRWELPNIKTSTRPSRSLEYLHHLWLTVRLMLGTARAFRFNVTVHAALNCAAYVLLDDKSAPVSVQIKTNKRRDQNKHSLSIFVVAEQKLSKLSCIFQDHVKNSVKVKIKLKLSSFFKFLNTMKRTIEINKKNEYSINRLTSCF